MHLIAALHRILPTSSFLLAAGLLLVACGGSDAQDNSGTPGQPAGTSNATTAEQTRATGIAHAAVPEATDLPGPSWRVTARDQFNTQSTQEFVRLAGQSPSCRETVESRALDTLFGSDDGPEVGRAQIELQSVVAGDIMPVTLLVYVAVEPSEDDAAASAGEKQRVVASEQTKECIAGIVATALKNSAPAGSASIKLVAASAIGAVPRDGAASTFDIHITDATGNVEMRMSFYSWSQGRAVVEVLITGPMGDTSEAERTQILAAIDAKVAVAVNAPK